MSLSRKRSAVRRHWAFIRFASHSRRAASPSGTWSRPPRLYGSHSYICEVWQWYMSTFFSITLPTSTTTTGSKGVGLEKRSSTFTKIGFFSRCGVLARMLGTVTM